jgi:transmembrane sensor
MSEDRPSSPEDRRGDEALAEAAYWAVRLADGGYELDGQERHRFNRWLQEDPRREQAFLELSSLALQLGALPEELQRSITGAVLADQTSVLADQAPQLAGEPPVLVGETAKPELRRQRASWLAARQTWWGIGIAATLGTVVLAMLFARPSHVETAEYRTLVGQKNDIHLSDNSTVHMNTLTAFQWKGGDCKREVVLLYGEALFDVAHDAHCEFRVVVDDGVVIVHGTRFNVYRRARDDVTVTVLEGQVSVEEGSSAASLPKWKRDLHADQQIAYGVAGPTSDVHDALAEDAVKWREDVVAFNDEPLALVVTDLQRYTNRRISIEDQRLLSLHITGDLDIRDIRQTLARLERLTPVTVEAVGNNLLLRYRATDPKSTKSRQGSRS